MNRKLFFTILISALSTSAFAQVKGPVDKAARDPRRAENAAKADVHREGGPIIFNPPAAPRKDSAATVIKKKKKTCSN